MARLLKLRRFDVHSKFQVPGGRFRVRQFRGESTANLHFTYRALKMFQLYSIMIAIHMYNSNVLVFS